jgi:protein-tyrosine phosphatase
MKILMVCSGNVCRSPLAVGILKSKLSKKGIKADVDSAGFEPYHIGEGPDDNTLEFARSKGIDISEHKMRLFTLKDFDNFDRIYAMDHRGYREVMFLSRNEKDKLKVDYLLNTILPGQNRMLPNPHNGEDSDMEFAYKLIDKACEKIVRNLG